MKIKLGGIARNIDEKHLQVYKDKGYEVVEEPTAPAPEVPPTPEQPNEPADTGKKAAAK